MLKWIWRGLLTRLGMMAAEVPPPPHRRDPEVSQHFQVEREERHDLPPRSVPGDEPRREAQHHPHPAERRGSNQN